MRGEKILVSFGLMLILIAFIYFPASMTGNIIISGESQDIFIDNFDGTEYIDLNTLDNIECSNGKCKSSTFITETYTENIVALWHLDQISNSITPDSTTNNYDLTSSTNSIIPGKFTNTFNLTNKNSNLTYRGRILSQTAPKSGFSASFWVKLNSPVTYTQTIMDTVQSFRIEISSSSTEKASPRCSIKMFNGTTVKSGGNTPLSINIWSHVTCVYNPIGNKLLTYINGDLIDTQIAGGFTEFYEWGGAQLILGNKYNGGTGFTEGRIDDFAIFNRALTPAEVLSLSQSTNAISSNSETGEFASKTITLPETFYDVKPSWKESANGITMDLSFDGGTTWHTATKDQWLSETSLATNGATALKYKVFFTSNTELDQVNFTLEKAERNAPAKTFPMGMNLGEIKDWERHWAFVDIMKQKRIMRAIDSGGALYEAGEVNIPVDERGYPSQLPFTDEAGFPGKTFTKVRSALLYSGYNPLGTYKLTIEGDGKITFSGGLSGTYSGPGTHYINLTNQETVRMEIIQTNPSNPITNIEMIMPGGRCSENSFEYCNSNNDCDRTCIMFTENYKTEPFHPIFLKGLKGMQAIRFMKPQETNGVQKNLILWSNRTRKNDYTQAAVTGIAPEYIVELSNKLEADPWVHIPVYVNLGAPSVDNFATQFAIFLKNNLDSERKIYIEYSNELWNYHGSDLAFQGCLLGLADCYDYVKDCGDVGAYTCLKNSGIPDEEKTLSFRRMWAKSMAETFYLFEQVFAGQEDRLIKVFGTQQGNQGVTNNILGVFNDIDYVTSYIDNSQIPINPHKVHADALALGSYFGGPINKGICNEGITETITVDEILDRTEASIPTWKTITNTNIRLADEYNLDLIAYEGGQSLIPCTNSEKLTEAMAQANRHARMGEMYNEIFEYWNENVGGLFTAFLYIGIYNGYGYWGAAEYQDNLTTPKYLAIREWTDLYSNTTTDISSTPIIINPAPNATKGGGGGGGDIACYSYWSCEDWSNNIQFCGTRECVDTKSCATPTGEPNQSIICPEDSSIIITQKSYCGDKKCNKDETSENCDDCVNQSLIKKASNVINGKTLFGAISVAILIILMIIIFVIIKIIKNKDKDLSINSNDWSDN